MGCDKTESEVTDVPTTPAEPADVAGEHACGDHEEGACGGTADSAGGDAGLATARTFEVEPGGFAEANFKMDKGSTITVTFSRGTSDFAWNVHSHDHSGGTQNHQEGVARAGTVEFSAPADGVFSVLWKNTATAATPLDVSIDLGEGATIHSWMPAQ
ncbi:hypothetical protein DB30_04333 [Enhygromyxa salina]|uniref:Uncharacterized protein n=1 Tax=Enhygromyxa salina TaxID=215803 RepID=A0A0C2D9A2_9BACT|nr:hypothetical protein DB30_04333 [Enhygromyxa salina]